MFEDVLEEKNGERVAISKRLEALFEEFPVVSKESVAAALGLYLDVLVDILRGSLEVPIKWYREYCSKVEDYLAA